MHANLLPLSRTKSFGLGLTVASSRRSCERKRSGSFGLVSSEEFSNRNPLWSVDVMSAIAIVATATISTHHFCHLPMKQTAHASELTREMEKEHIKMAILRQEQTFRQQVCELHRVYRVQKQLMMEMQAVKMAQAQVSTETQIKPRLEMDQQWCSNSGEKKVPFIEDFDLELTLATGAGRKQEKPSSSDSGATVSSLNSAESDSEQRFPESNVALRFPNESKRHDDQLMQSPWLYQCLSLKTA
ncbi:hypothetical protein ABZP36_011421 [Zizania latifolia]